MSIQSAESLAKWAQMVTQEEQAIAQIRRISLVQGNGMGIYATEDIWHGQEAMLANQEHTSDPEEDSRLEPVEKRELSHEWDEIRNPLGLGEDTEGSQ